MPGTLFVVATPIGNLEDITIRALRVLRDVAVVAAEDTRRTAQLLSRHAISTPMTSLHEHNETRKSAAILARLERGESVALVSDAGTPAVSDPGTRLVREAIAAGIKVEPVPGPSAVLAALTASGFSADAFTFLGFPPTKAKDRSAWFERMRLARGTVVFFEAPHRIEATLRETLELVGDWPITVARELTKIHEQLVNGPMSEVVERLGAPRGEYTVVIDIGQTTDSNAPQVIPESNSRRQALAAVAKSHGLTANQLYSAIEDAKKSVGRPT
jgi:16S rRNA (cytidine1402-2'-O)-methyltransferase